MHEYGVRDVEKLLRLPRSTIRSLIDAGFRVAGARPAQRMAVFFQDLIVLRTARAGRSQVPAQAHHQIDEGASPPSARIDAAIRSFDLRGSRSRRRQRRPQPLAS